VPLIVPDCALAAAAVITANPKAAIADPIRDLTLPP
jgi:hypothetical protein